MWNHILLKLIHCFLITYKTEHLVCLLLFIVSLYVKCLFMSFANFLFLFLIFVANISSWLFSCHCLWRVVCYLVICIIVSQVVQWSRICLSMQETQVLSLGWEDPLEKRMTTHSSILAWKIPLSEESGWLQSMRLQRVRHSWATNMFMFPPKKDNLRKRTMIGGGWYLKL